MKKIKENYMLILVALITVGVVLALQALTGDWFFKSQPYNSYILQAWH